MESFFPGQDVCDFGTGDIHPAGFQGGFMQDMLELGVVAGPVIAGQHFQGRGFETEKLAAQFHVQVGKIETGEGRDLIPPVPQRRHGKRYRGKPGGKLTGKGMQRTSVHGFTGKNQPQALCQACFLDQGKQRLLPLERKRLHMIKEHGGMQCAQRR